MRLHPDHFLVVENVGEELLLFRQHHFRKPPVAHELEFRESRYGERRAGCRFARYVRPWRPLTGSSLLLRSCVCFLISGRIARLCIRLDFRELGCGFILDQEFDQVAVQNIPTV